MRESLKHSDVVVNLMGKYYETKHVVPTRRADGTLSRINYDFDELNVEIAARVARLAKEAGVKSLIHVSAMSADLNSASKWSRTKAMGELAVREQFPEAVSLIFFCLQLMCHPFTSHFSDFFLDYCTTCNSVWRGR